MTRRLGCTVILLSLTLWPVHGAAQSGVRRVSALGRIEPENGVVRVGAPSLPLAISGSIVSSLEVEEGEDVRRGQLLAVMDSARVYASLVQEGEAELALARSEATAAESLADAICIEADTAAREATRRADLFARGAVAEEETEAARSAAESKAASCASQRLAFDVATARVAVAEARVARHRAELERAHVRAPSDGRVLMVHAWPGEFVAPTMGIVEIGRVDRMYAIAEVYETDIGRVEVGAPARVTSDALGAPLSGRVERIRLKVHKQDELGTDPAARKDARIVEVEVLLDDPARAADFTNLQVQVVIGS